MGEERVEDLVRRGLVSVNKRKSNGRIKSITVHDLLWDLCLYEAREENSILHVDGSYQGCGTSVITPLFRSEAISNLENLQTLIICPRENDGAMFGKLPKGVWRSHRVSFRVTQSKRRDETTSALENLQTLSRVVDFICSRETLKMICNLKKLALLYTKKLRDVKEDLELHNLIYLHKLEILKIEMDWSSFGKEHEMSTRCAFPPTLKK